MFVVDLSIGTTGGWRSWKNSGSPAVVIGTPAGAGSLPAVWQDDAAAIRAVVDYLAEGRASPDRPRVRHPPVVAYEDPHRRIP